MLSTVSPSVAPLSILCKRKRSRSLEWDDKQAKKLRSSTLNCILQRLPREMLLFILEFLPVSVICNKVSLVNKQLFSIASSAELWFNLAKRFFEPLVRKRNSFIHCLMPKNGNTWKDVFRNLYLSPIEHNLYISSNDVEENQPCPMCSQELVEIALQNNAFLTCNCGFQIQECYESDDEEQMYQVPSPRQRDLNSCMCGTMPISKVPQCASCSKGICRHCPTITLQSECQYCQHTVYICDVCSDKSLECPNCESIMGDDDDDDVVLFGTVSSDDSVNLDNYDSGDNSLLSKIPSLRSLE